MISSHISIGFGFIKARRSVRDPRAMASKKKKKPMPCYRVYTLSFDIHKQTLNHNLQATSLYNERDIDIADELVISPTPRRPEPQILPGRLVFANDTGA